MRYGSVSLCHYQHLHVRKHVAEKVVSEQLKTVSVISCLVSSGYSYMSSRWLYDTRDLFGVGLLCFSNSKGMKSELKSVMQCKLSGCIV